MISAQRYRAPQLSAMYRIASQEYRSSSAIEIVKPNKGRFCVGFEIRFMGSRSLSIISSYQFPTILRFEDELRINNFNCAELSPLKLSEKSAYRRKRTRLPYDRKIEPCRDCRA